MFRLTSRGVRRSLALMLPALGACADESPPLTGPKPALKANLVAGDVASSSPMPAAEPIRARSDG